jgi:hypothetical protein
MDGGLRVAFFVSAKGGFRAIVELRLQYGGSPELLLLRPLYDRKQCLFVADPTKTIIVSALNFLNILFSNAISLKQAINPSTFPRHS